MEKRMVRFLNISLLVSLALTLSFLPCRESYGVKGDFPKKEVTIVVNYGPGGARDVLARGIGKTMSKYLEVPVVVMNIVGAGGIRGLISLYNSPPDGYSIGIGMAPEILNQILEKQDYDIKKFVYLGRVQASPIFLVVKSDSPFHSIKDFKTFGKTVRHSTFSITSNTTVVPIIIANREGWSLSIVGGYKGAADATLALIRGEVEFAGVTQSSGNPFFKAKQIRPILTVDQRRSPAFPDIPTVGEVGHSDLDCLAGNVWLMAPPGVPKDRIKILEDALMKTVKDPEFLEWSKGAGVDPAWLSGEETTRLVFNLFGLLERYKGDIQKHIK